jgi:hypothetical protein
MPIVPHSYNSSFLKGQLRALANHYGGVVADHLNAAAERLDELERDLGLERESHEVTKRMYDDAASSSGPESEAVKLLRRCHDAGDLVTPLDETLREDVAAFFGCSSATREIE